jgi:hypothetical protein
MEYAQHYTSVSYHPDKKSPNAALCQSCLHPADRACIRQIMPRLILRAASPYRSPPGDIFCSLEVSPHSLPTCSSLASARAPSKTPKRSPQWRSSHRLLPLAVRPPRPPRQSRRDRRPSGFRRGGTCVPPQPIAVGSVCACWARAIPRRASAAFP